MPKGLPKFEQIFDLDQNDSIEPKTRQLNKPKSLNKVRIEAVDEAFNEGLAEVSLNPNTINEQKSANWAKKYIPGQSDPLLQWINGTERVVSFDVYVTRDKEENETIRSGESESFTIVTNDFSSFGGGLDVASSVVPSTEGTLLESLNPFFNEFNSPDTDQQNKDYWSISIQSYLDYYRSLLVPRTSSRRNQVKTPPLIKLKMGSILGNPSQMDKTRWILASYNTNITKFTPELDPIEATVSFTFIEYVSKSRSLNAEQVKANLRGKRNNSAEKSAIIETPQEISTTSINSSIQNLV